jgi:thioredoxin reductase (NADPH)
MKTVVIIGGGPAGCQNALWLHKLGFNPIIIEQKDSLGGLHSINPYENTWIIGMMNLTGYEIAQNIENHIQKLKIPILFNSAVSSIVQIENGFELIVNQKIISCSFIVIATGVIPKSAEFVPSENVLIGPGTKIDDFNFKDKKVAIFGGGDNSAENYCYIQAKKPKVCHVFARTLRARENLKCHIDHKNIFLNQYSVNQNSMQVEHQNIIRSYDVFVVFYGWQASIPEVFEPFKQLLLNEKNFIIIDENRETKIPRIFAAGEVTQKLHPCVITAMADGIMAAKAIERAVFKLPL